MSQFESSLWWTKERERFCTNFSRDLPGYQAGCFAVQDDMLALLAAGLGTNAIHTYNWRQGATEGRIRLGGELAFRNSFGVAVSGKMLYVSEQGDVGGRPWPDLDPAPAR